jgi:hypothetical protein
MDVSARYVIKLSVYDKQGFDEYHMATDSDEFPVFSERFVDEMKAGLAFVGSRNMRMDETVNVLRKREFRREFLLHAAKKLAARLADYIEDKEGWHGDDRRDRIKEVERR